MPSLIVAGTGNQIAAGSTVNAAVGSAINTGGELVVAGNLIGGSGFTLNGGTLAAGTSGGTIGTADQSGARRRRALPSLPGPPCPPDTAP